MISHANNTILGLQVQKLTVKPEILYKPVFLLDTLIAVINSLCLEIFEILARY